MFSTLEGTWDRSARRGWTTLASFSMQVFGLSLLLLIPLFTIQGPTKLPWFETPPILLPPPAPAPPTGDRQPMHPSNTVERELQQPRAIPLTIANTNDQIVASSPDVSGLGVMGAPGMGTGRVLGGTGISMDAAPPPPPAPARPLKVSHWAEGNLIYQVQPLYPPIARQARVQGAVELRAIISKSGTIENLVVVRGHPMLSAAAIEAVKQWRYRPYLLNNEPIEVETEITVNFLLSGG
jgi:protein TonB